MLLAQLLQLLLALHVLSVALLHVLVDSLESLLILRHAGVQVLLGLFLLLEDCIIIDLFYVFPFLIHLLLDVDDHRILEPYAVVVLVLDQCIANVVTANAAEYQLYISALHSCPLLLYYVQGLQQLFIVLECILQLLL